MRLIALIALLLSIGCKDPAPPPAAPPDKTVEAPPSKAKPVTPEDRTKRDRHHMVKTQIEARGVKDPKVLTAMRAVERHRLVNEKYRGLAYSDRPLPIAAGQTISQPYIVALMTELLELPEGGGKVLEVGTGSGYQAAVLAEMGAKVFSIEIVPELGKAAATALKDMGYSDRVQTRIGDGYRGWPEHAPFDAIIVTAAPNHIPKPLIEQLSPNGRMVIPVGDDRQQLQVVVRTKDGHKIEDTIPVRFVPMTGEAQD